MKALHFLEKKSYLSLRLFNTKFKTHRFVGIVGEVGFASYTFRKCFSESSAYPWTFWTFFLKKDQEIKNNDFDLKETPFSENRKKN